MSEVWIEDVLHFWFDEVGDERWFVRDEALDAAVHERFRSLHERIAAEPVETFTVPPACVAGVIVLDQFPRNMYRGSPRAFATDAQALTLSRYALDRGFDREAPPEHRLFLYMPWQHAEDPVAQIRSVQLFEQLGLDQPLHFAREHKRVIDLFGRFPHRNAVLGRASTPQELQFVQTHPGF